MKFTTFTALFTTIMMLLVSTIYAQQPSPDSEKEAAENIRQRIENNNIEAKDVLSTSPKAFVGSVQDIVQNNIAIATKDGQRFATPIDQATIVRTPGNKEIELESVQIDDFIIAMGYMVSNTKLDASRIIVSQTLTSGLNKTTGRATVDDINNSVISLTDDTNEVASLDIDRNTIFKDENGVIDRDDIISGDTIIYTAKIDSANNYSATIIMKTLLTE